MMHCISCVIAGKLPESEERTHEDKRMHKCMYMRHKDVRVQARARAHIYYIFSEMFIHSVEGFTHFSSCVRNCTRVSLTYQFHSAPNTARGRRWITGAGRRRSESNGACKPIVYIYICTIVANLQFCCIHDDCRAILVPASSCTHRESRPNRDSARIKPDCDRISR